MICIVFVGIVIMIIFVLLIVLLSDNVVFILVGKIIFGK